MRRAAIWMCVAGVLLGWTSTARAIPYKNPAHGFKAGSTTAGVMVESSSRDIEGGGTTSGADATLVMGAFGIGVGTAGVLELRGGFLSTQLEGEESADGTVFGAAYRHNLSQPGQALRHGLVLAYHVGYTSNDFTETDSFQLDVAYGVAFPLGNDATLYAGGAFSSLTGTIFFPGSSVDFEGADPIGGFAGIEFDAGPQLKLGVEAHLLHETAFGVYLDGVF